MKTRITKQEINQSIDKLEAMANDQYKRPGMKSCKVHCRWPECDLPGMAPDDCNHAQIRKRDQGKKQKRLHRLLEIYLYCVANNDPETALKASGQYFKIKHDK